MGGANIGAVIERKLAIWQNARSRTARKKTDGRHRFALAWSNFLRECTTTWKWCGGGGSGGSCEVLRYAEACFFFWIPPGPRDEKSPEQQQQRVCLNLVELNLNPVKMVRRIWDLIGIRLQLECFPTREGGEECRMSELLMGSGLIA